MTEATQDNAPQDNEPEVPADLNIPSIHVSFEFPDQEDELVAFIDLGPEDSDKFVLEVMSEDGDENEFIQKWRDSADNNELDFINDDEDEEDFEVSDDDLR